MSKHDLTASALRAVLGFNQTTGVFTRLTDMGRYGRFKAGEPAGSQDSNGYLLIRLHGHRYGAHRLAWLHHYGEWPTGQIDHKNGIRHDNRIANLRDATALINAQNVRSPRCTNTSGFLGVSWHKGTKSWIAQMWIGRKNRTIGYFATAKEAGDAYVEAKRKHHVGCTI